MRPASSLLLVVLLAGCASKAPAPVVVEREAHCPHVPAELTRVIRAPSADWVRTNQDVRAYVYDLLETLGHSNADKRAIREILERGSHPTERTGS